ncbi:hypothetical protein FKB36_07020 [Methanoculleus sp. Afa-1]|jgi:membrane protein YdbS with pleckstrin-like domain|uniref:Uncharacterized protein n=1 Tax=Methanoculleus formosensis TaxID=2590886 RepID=A0A9E4ZP04_9EURY|nr:hypothetical protein [Methanoculleus sp. Afa-1]
MDVTEVRTWVIFYLISFVVLLAATFITTQSGSQLWISLMLIIIVVGVNFYLLFSELKRYQARRAFMHRMSQFEEDETDVESGYLW